MIDCRQGDAVVVEAQLERKRQLSTFRKVGADEATTWEIGAGSTRSIDDRYDWVGGPAVLFLQGKPRSLACALRIDDVLRLRAPENTPPERAIGIVVGVRLRTDGVWTHAQLAVNGEIRWMSKSMIAAHLGRAKGLTRVDQPTKLLNGRVHRGTYGWFVRIYEGSTRGWHVPSAIARRVGAAGAQGGVGVPRCTCWARGGQGDCIRMNA